MLVGGSLGRTADVPAWRWKQAHARVGCLSVYMIEQMFQYVKGRFWLFGWGFVGRSDLPLNWTCNISCGTVQLWTLQVVVEQGKQLRKGRLGDFNQDNHQVDIEANIWIP